MNEKELNIDPAVEAEASQETISKIEQIPTIEPDNAENIEVHEEIEALELPNLQEEPFQDNADKSNRKRKVFITAGAFLLSIVIIIGTVFVIKIFKENQAIKKVEQTIYNIGTIDTSDDTTQRLNEAAQLYNALTDKQKKKVDNSSMLTAKYNEHQNLLAKQEYYNTLVTACKALNEKFEAVEEALDGTVNVWRNVITRTKDSYNNGNYDFNTAVDAYWKSADYLTLSLKTFSSSKTSYGKSLDDYVEELKQVPDEYKNEHDAFILLYATYSAAEELTGSINHTFNAYTNEISDLKSDYRRQYGKVKALIPEVY